MAYAKILNLNQIDNETGRNKKLPGFFLQLSIDITATEGLNQTEGDLDLDTDRSCLEIGDPGLIRL